MTTNCWSASTRVQSAFASSPFPAGCQSKFLQGLIPSDIEAVLRTSTLRRFAANAVVANQGDPADYFFLLTNGCARQFSITEDGQKILLLWLAAGDVFGGLALWPEPSSYLVSTEVVKGSCAIVWRRSEIRDVIARHPRLQDNLLSIAYECMTWFLASHMALISHTARQRLARVLTSLARGVGRKVSGGIELDITNEELANTANVTLFTASRLLSEWHRSGSISKSRGSVVLHHPERLLKHQG